MCSSRMDCSNEWADSRIRRMSARNCSRAWRRLRQVSPVDPPLAAARAVVAAAEQEAAAGSPAEEAAAGGEVVVPLLRLGPRASNPPALRVVTLLRQEDQQSFTEALRPPLDRCWFES